MNKIKELINTVAVVLANLLDLSPTGWKASKQQAMEMVAAKEKVASNTDVEVRTGDGSYEALVNQPSFSPLGFLLNRLVNTCTGVCAVYLCYLVFQALAGTMVLCVLCALVAAGVMKLMSWIKPESSAPVPQAA